MQFLARNSSSSATASAAPSSGAVPVPISSTSTSEHGVADCSMDFKFSMCAENVERSAAMDCSSPISTSTRSKSGSTARCAATGIPDCAERAASPVVFNATVFPPVFGPLMTSNRSSPPRVSVMDTIGRFSLRSLSSRNAVGRRFQAQFRDLGEFWRAGIEIPREPASGKNAVELGNRRGGCKQRPSHHLQTLRQLAQNPRDFRGFVFRKLHKLIIRFDGFERLHENGLPGRACSMHDARHTSAVFRAHGNDKSLIAQRDVVFAYFGVSRTQDLLKGFLDRFARLRDAGANPVQGLRGVIADLAIRKDASPDGRQYVAQIGERSRT